MYRSRATLVSAPLCGGQGNVPLCGLIRILPMHLWGGGNGHRILQTAGEEDEAE